MGRRKMWRIEGFDEQTPTWVREILDEAACDGAPKKTNPS
jgi:hypothetical protein